jgi:BirA family transcriptional regulator, biotin operon repressor / biotin---[acetyl-CoA-carboxylase] ligase
MLGNNILRLSETASTNTYAAKLLMAEKPAEGTVIFSVSQTEGKGQQGNIWESESGKNLTVSVILYPYFLKPEKQFILNKIISLAVLDLVKLHVPVNMSPKIKWPNDIFVGDKKIAGILIENSIMGNRIENAIAGIGININQEKFTGNAPNPVSLKLITGKEYCIEDCLKDFCVFLNNRYEQLRKNFYKEIDADYLANNYRYNIFSKFRKNKSILNAKISGISEFGKLQLKDINENISEYAFKEIEYII